MRKPVPTSARRHIRAVIPLGKGAQDRLAAATAAAGSKESKGTKLSLKMLQVPAAEEEAQGGGADVDDGPWKVSLGHGVGTRGGWGFGGVERGDSWSARLTGVDP